MTTLDRLSLPIALALLGFSVPLLLMWLADWRERRFDDDDAA